MLNHEQPKFLTWVPATHSRLFTRQQQSEDVYQYHLGLLYTPDAKISQFSNDPAYITGGFWHHNLVELAQKHPRYPA